MFEKEHALKTVKVFLNAVMSRYGKYKAFCKESSFRNYMHYIFDKYSIDNLLNAIFNQVVYNLLV